MNKNILCIVVCVLAILLMTVLDSRGQIGITGNAAFVGAAGFSAASGGGGGSPGWQAEANRGGGITDSGANTYYDYTAGSSIATGKRAVLVFFLNSAQTVTGVTSSGNTWAQDVATNYVNNANWRLYIFSAHVASAIGPSDNIRVNFSGAIYAYTTWQLQVLTNVASSSAVDVFAAETKPYSTSATPTATTSTATAIVGGLVFEDDRSLSSSTFAAIGATQTNATMRLSVMQHPSSAGSKNMNAVLDGNTGTIAVWAAYK